MTYSQTCCMRCTLQFKVLVSEVDESGDKDKMAMFADALPKQQKMLMESGLLIRICLNLFIISCKSVG